eukprot:scaffold383971_cov35-Attheya_sp.AAC.1
MKLSCLMCRVIHYSHRPYVCPSLKGGAAAARPFRGDRGTDDGYRVRVIGCPIRLDYSISKDPPASARESES